MTSYRLRDKADLSQVREMVREAAEDAGARPTDILDCLVSVTEACTNALVHGQSPTGAPDPVVAWEIDGRAARFVVQDYAGQPGSSAWWTEDRPWVGMDSGAGSAPSGGFGLGLMRNLMDEVDITSGSGGTVVVLVKHWD